MIDAKDLLLQVGVVVTLGLGLINLYFNLRTARRTAFINTVTSERVKWIGKVRDNVAILSSLCEQWMFHRTQESTPELRRQIERMKNEIMLQLNPDDPADRKIDEMLAALPSSTNLVLPEDYPKRQAALVSATQARLKREWDKVKDEAIRGDLRPRYNNTLSPVEKVLLGIATLFVIVGLVALISPQQLAIAYQAFHGLSRGRIYGLGAIIVGCGLGVFVLRASKKS